MPVPKRKRSRARRDKRFANKGLKVTSFAYCAQCKEPQVPHTACRHCGFYKGVKVMNTKADRGSMRQVVRAAKAGQQAASEAAQETEVSEQKS